MHVQSRYYVPKQTTVYSRLYREVQQYDPAPGRYLNYINTVTLMRASIYTVVRSLRNLYIGYI